ncbi:hypothetical protein Gohar_008676 [Gossypium harknessii]|uniref:Uncharacterized protein n=1 Tax=Gossypium harknessii TaxID=34285 RepID=A0A7J9GKE0_9ROSI|nr:hypothetical protein [Gossypium harknessii]
MVHIKKPRIGQLQVLWSEIWKETSFYPTQKFTMMYRLLLLLKP